MNFDFSDDQQAIKRRPRTLGRALRRRSRARARRGRPLRRRRGRRSASSAGRGSSSARSTAARVSGIVELVILMEELGYALAPLPFLSRVAAGLALELAGSDEQRARWLPGIASGELRATAGLATERRGPSGPGRGRRRADRAAEPRRRQARRGGQCRGGGDRDDRRHAPLRARSGRRRRAARRRRRRGPRPHRSGAVGGADGRGAASDGDGRGLRARAQAVRRPIGAYQAVAHRCAQMLLETEGSRSASYYAAWTADAEPESLPRRPRWPRRIPRTPPGG